MHLLNQSPLEGDMTPLTPAPPPSSPDPTLYTRTKTRLLMRETESEAYDTIHHPDNTDLSDTLLASGPTTFNPSFESDSRQPAFSDTTIEDMAIDDTIDPSVLFGSTAPYVPAPSPYPDPFSTPTLHARPLYDPFDNPELQPTDKTLHHPSVNSLAAAHLNAGTETTAHRGIYSNLSAMQQYMQNQQQGLKQGFSSRYTAPTSAPSINNFQRVPTYAPRRPSRGDDSLFVPNANFPANNSTTDASFAHTPSTARSHPGIFTHAIAPGASHFMQTNAQHRSPNPYFAASNAPIDLTQSPLSIFEAQKRATPIQQFFNAATYSGHYSQLLEFNGNYFTLTECCLIVVMLRDLGCDADTVSEILKLHRQSFNPLPLSHFQHHLFQPSNDRHRLAITTELQARNSHWRRVGQGCYQRYLAVMGDLVKRLWREGGVEISGRIKGMDRGEQMTKMKRGLKGVGSEEKEGWEGKMVREGEEDDDDGSGEYGVDEIDFSNPPGRKRRSERRHPRRESVGDEQDDVWLQAGCANPLREYAESVGHQR